MTAFADVSALSYTRALKAAMEMTREVMAANVYNNGFTMKISLPVGWRESYESALKEAVRLRTIRDAGL